MKRILCLVSAMDAGGAETFLMKILRNLDHSEYQMDFCVNEQKPGFYEKEIEALGGKIYRIPSKSENIKAFKRGLSKIVKDNHYKNVMRITSNAFGFYDLYVAKRAGAENTIARSSNSSDGGSFKSKAVHILGKLFYKRYVDVFIAPSDKAAVYTFGKKAFKKGQVHLLNNGIDFLEYRFSGENRERIRKELGVLESTLLIGHIGRFTKQKNHDFLLDVFAKIKKAHPNAKLLLVGEGELEDRIKDKIKNLGLGGNVIISGVRKDVPALLSALDMLLFPSLYEGMPNVIIEAQATGLPCLIADTITKQVAVTPLVTFLPITDTEVWEAAAEDIITANKQNLDKRDKISLPESYNINKVVKTFTSLLK